MTVYLSKAGNKKQKIINIKNLMFNGFKSKYKEILKIWDFNEIYKNRDDSIFKLLNNQLFNVYQKLVK